jgi:exodeoxyribonuclease VII small subunit
MGVKGFEEALKELEEIVNRLERGDLSLEEALKLFEEGVKLSRYCHKKLDEAQKKVEILLKNETGQMVHTPFEPNGGEEK